MAYLKLNRFEEATQLAEETDIPLFKISVDAYIAIAKNEFSKGLELTELMESSDRFGSITYYLQLGLWEKALVRLEEAYEQHNPKLILSIQQQEEYQDQPELSSFMNKPEIKALLEIRKNNRAVTN